MESLEGDGETSKSDESGRLKKYVFGENYISMYNMSIMTTFGGALLALTSGVLFTANNFVLKESKVSVGDVVLVRSVLQLLVYLTLILCKTENFLPPETGSRICVVLQGE